jgi:hypothetical protein
VIPRPKTMAHRKKKIFDVVTIILNIRFIYKYQSYISVFKEKIWFLNFF